MRLRALSWLLVLLIVGTLPLAAQTDLYARKFVLPHPTPDIGWGNAVAGVDFDGDGMFEIYAVNNNMYDQPQEMMPAIYKYELDTLTNESEHSVALTRCRKSSVRTPGRP